MYNYQAVVVDSMLYRIFKIRFGEGGLTRDRL